MKKNDLADVCRIASLCHPDYPEDEDILAEKQALSPETCFILEKDGEAVGYALAHPWVAGEAPALNKKLGAIPPNADILYLHDIAISPSARRTGSGAQAFERLQEVGKKLGFKMLTLVAVNNSASYWQGKGFKMPEPDENLKAKLLTYSPDALYLTKDI